MALEDTLVEEPGLAQEAPMLLAQGPGLSMQQAPQAMAPAPQAEAPQGLSAVPGPRAAPQKQDPVTSMMNFFRDPKRLGAAAAAAAAAEDPQTLQWLKRGYEAQKENAGEALAKLVAGDTQGAMDAFNLGGQMAAESIEPGSKKGTFKITMKGGASREIDPQKELMSLLTPPQMMQHMRNEEANAIRLQLGQGLIDARNTATAARSEAEAAKAAQRDADQARRLAESEARIANLHANTARTIGLAERGAAGGGEAKPLTQHQFQSGVRGAVNDVLSDVDEITGKKKPGDPAVAIRLKTMAESMWKKDKTLTPAEAVERAKQVYDEAFARAQEKVDREVEGAQKAVAVKPTSPSTWGNLFTGPDFKGKKPEEYKASRLKEEVERELKGASKEAPNSAPKSLPPTNAKGWKLHTDKQGNRAYVSPDGKSYEEAQ